MYLFIDDSFSISSFYIVSAVIPPSTSNWSRLLSSSSSPGWLDIICGWMIQERCISTQFSMCQCQHVHMCPVTAVCDHTGILNYNKRRILRADYGQSIAAQSHILIQFYQLPTFLFVSSDHHHHLGPFCENIQFFKHKIVNFGIYV